jgi:RNA recognition motif-containing protein
MVNTKLHIDNLSADTTENDLRELFSAYGNVAAVHVPTNRTSGRSRGFGFVTMETAAGARSAIQALNGKILRTFPLTVSSAWPHEQRANSAGAN